MRKTFTVFMLVLLWGSLVYSQQDGNNNLWGVPKISLGINSTDTLLSVAGRSVEFVSGLNNQDLDGDGLAEILVPDYNNGGRVHVFEQVAKNSLEFKLVWSSKKLKPNYKGVLAANPNSMPRAVFYGDIDGNGKKEIIVTFERRATTKLTDTTWGRGLYFYENTGNNTFMDDPYYISMSEIDSFTNYHNFLREEKGGMQIIDVDGDAKQELLLGSFDFGFNDDLRKNASKVYVLSAKSGTIAARTMKLDTEYVYRGLAKCLSDGTDGYVCSGVKAADIDGDGRMEVVVIGETNNGSGGGMGFFKSTAANKYKDGNFVDLGNELKANLFRVTSELGVYRPTGADRDYVYLNTDEAAGDNRLLMLSDVIDIDLVTLNNLTVLKKGAFGFTGAAAGNQDHGTGTGNDGYDIYVPTKDAQGILDFEYTGTGTGQLADSTKYKQYEIFNAKKVFKNGNGGIYHIIVPNYDINGNGRKEIIANFQIYGPDTTVNGKIPVKATCPFFVIEWGDTTMGTVSVKPLVMITDEDYKLEQNYPNPFNPTTSIRFSLPTNENINLIVYDINGKEVRTLINNKEYVKGSYKVTWDAKDNFGKVVSSGVYFTKLKWGNFEKSMKMSFLK